MPPRALRDEMQPDAEPGTMDALPPEMPPEPPMTPMDSLQLPLDAAAQRTAVETVMSDFEAAKLARDSRDFGMGSKGEKLAFDDWLKELKDLYYGRRQPKVEPWKFCSNRSLMIAMAILETLHARIFPAVYSEELTRFRPGEKNDAPKVERVEKLMYWWTRVRADLRDFFDRWVRHTLCMPYTVTETQWDVSYRDKGMSAPPPGIPGVAPAAPERVLEPIYRTRSDIYAVEDVFLQEGASDIQRDPVVVQMRYFFRDLEDMERQGQAVNISTPTDPGTPSLADSIPVDAPAGEGLDAAAVDELKKIRLRNKPVTVLKWFGGVDLDGDGHPEQVRILVCPEYRLYLGGVAISDLSARGERQLDITSYMPRFDEPHGLWGMGVLEQVKELALEIDAIFNQMTDANTLSILRPGFYDPSGNLDAPVLKLRPNTLTPLNRPNEGLFFPQLDIPTERLVLAIRLVLEFIERLTAASAYVLGKESEIVGGSGTATRVEAIVGAADQRHGIPTERLRAGAARIITQHLDCLQKNIPPGLEQRVLGMDGEQVFGTNELTEQGIAGEFDCFLLPDDSMGSKAVERQLAASLYQALMPNVIVASDPAKIYKLTADFLKAHGKDPLAYLGPAPEIVGATSPLDEHTLIIQGEFGKVKVTPTQNPLEHIMAHQAFLQDPVLATLPPTLVAEVQMFMQQHLEQHVQMLQTIMSAAASQPTPGKGGPEENGANGNGAESGSSSPTNPAAQQPGMGSVQSPLGAAQQSQRGGQSRGTAVGAR